MKVKMGKINGCLKCLFIFFNGVFAILGGVLIYSAVQAMVVSHQMRATGLPMIGWLWAFAISVLAISCLAIYAACSENQIVLKVFAGLMGLAMIIMLIFGIVAFMNRNKIKEEFHSPNSDVVKILIEEESHLNQFQEVARCCGVVGPEDWGSHIPSSCECQGSYVNKCRSKPQGTSGPAQIYNKTCGADIFFYVNVAFNISIGVCFGFAIIALMGLLISLLMIHQLRRYDGDGGQSMAMRSF